MNKKIIRYIISGFLGILMIGAFIYLGTKEYETVPKESDAAILSKAFNQLEKENIFNILASDEASKFINSGSGIILFCTNSSEWCNYYAASINRVAKSLNIEDVKYLDILKDRNAKTYYYQKLITATSKYLTKNDLGEYILSVPDVYVVKNGSILGHNNEASSTIGDITPSEYFTKEKIIELETNLKELFSKL